MNLEEFVQRGQAAQAAVDKLTAPKTLRDLKPGDKVIVRNGDGSYFGYGIVDAASDERRIVTHTDGRWYSDTAWSRRSAKMIGAGRHAERYIEPATDEQIAAAEAEEERRLQAKADEDDRRRQAEYDALPEAVKLARKLCYLCDTMGENKLAEAPIDHLRGLVAWAKERGLEME